jgi:DNA-binding response OmpR family regulator
MKENIISRAGEPVGASFQCPTEPICRILLVDDYRAIRQLIPEVLNNSGYEVDTAADGAAAWEALQVKPFNLLITDYDMPKLTGVELVRKLRSASMTLPVILTSGSLPTEELAQNPSLQLAAMLLKPFSPEELLGTVSTVLNATVSAPGQLEPLPDWRSLLQPTSFDIAFERFRNAKEVVGNNQKTGLVNLQAWQTTMKYRHQ